MHDQRIPFRRPNRQSFQTLSCTQSIWLRANVVRLLQFQLFFSVRLLYHYHSFIATVTVLDNGHASVRHSFIKTCNTWHSLIWYFVTLWRANRFRLCFHLWRNGNVTFRHKSKHCCDRCFFLTCRIMNFSEKKYKESCTKAKFIFKLKSFESKWQKVFFDWRWNTAFIGSLQWI